MVADVSRNIATMRGYLQTVQWPEDRVILGSAVELHLALEAMATPSATLWKDGKMEIIALDR